MARIFAQHAHCGEYHLETRYVPPGDRGEPARWEWAAAVQGPHGLPEFSGDADNLEGAKRSACHAIGLAFANWMPIGPAIDVPD
jgi:hypothetical protein